MPPVSFDVTALLRLPRVGELALSPDGSWAAVVVQRLDGDDLRYVADLWRVPTDGGAAIRLTAGAASDTHPRFAPDGRLWFLSDRDPVTGGAAAADARRAQVWVLGPGAVGAPVAVTDEPLGVSGFAITASHLFVLAEVLPGVARDQQRARAADLGRGPSALRYADHRVRHWDAWLPATGLHLLAQAVLPPADGAAPPTVGPALDLTPDARHELRNLWSDPALGARGARAVVAVSVPPAAATAIDRNDDGCLRLFEVAGGDAAAAPTLRAARDLGRDPGVTYEGVRLSPAGARVLTSRARRQPPRSGRVTLWCFELDGGAGREVAGGWDLRGHPQAWRDDATALVVADDDGDVPVFAVGVDDDRVERLTGPGVYEHVASAGGIAAAIHHRTLVPPNPVRLDAAAGAAPVRLATLTPTPPALEGLVVERHATAVPAADGAVAADDARVTWLLARPAPPDDGAAPLLFWIHGGPEGQFADGWHWRWNVGVAVAAGYAVALPNPRGSTGRGQAWIDPVRDNRWGDTCYRDLMAVADDVSARPGLDGRRVAAMGGSFGGYMVNWIGTRTDRFAALVSHAGIAHLDAFRGTTDYPTFFAMAMGGTPLTGGVDLDRYSPHAHLRGWRTPVLVIHGERDFRVPVSDALILYNGLREVGAPAELLIFPDEGHWIGKPRNIRAWYEAWMGFVATHLAAAGQEPRRAEPPREETR